MAVPNNMDALEWLRRNLVDDNDVLREMVRTFAERLMAAEVEAICDAGYGEVTPERTTSRNGYRSRPLDTRVGSIDLAIPKLREGCYYPGFLSMTAWVLPSTAVGAELDPNRGAATGRRGGARAHRCAPPMSPRRPARVPLADVKFGVHSGGVVPRKVADQLVVARRQVECGPPERTGVDAVTGSSATGL